MLNKRDYELEELLNRPINQRNAIYERAYEYRLPVIKYLQIFSPSFYITNCSPGSKTIDTAASRHRP